MMFFGFRALITKDWSRWSWGVKLLGYVQPSLDVWGRVKFYRLSKRTAALAGLVLARSSFWATMMNATKATQKHEAVQTGGFCHCAGKGAIVPGIMVDGLV